MPNLYYYNIIFDDHKPYQVYKVVKKVRGVFSDFWITNCIKTFFAPSVCNRSGQSCKVTTHDSQLSFTHFYMKYLWGIFFRIIYSTCDQFSISIEVQSISLLLPGKFWPIVKLLTMSLCNTKFMKITIWSIEI